MTLMMVVESAHGKSVNLKHITVKVPNKRLAVARAMTTPSNTTGMITIDQTDQTHVDNHPKNLSSNSTVTVPISIPLLHTVSDASFTMV